MYEKLADQELFQLCKKYGEQARMWKQKFAGLLPEVNRRRLYEKKGFESIFVFAAKLAGMSKEQVNRVLNLNEKFADKPVLQKMLVEGEVSVNKLARVASIATVENQKELATQVQLLSQSAIETLVRDERAIQNGLFEPEKEDKFVRTHNITDLKLSPEILQKLLDLQNKGIDINAIIGQALENREKEIAEQKKQISKTVLQEGLTKKRYIKVKIKKIIQQEYGTKCSIQTCQKSAEIIHHTQHFVLSQNHNPYFLAPLCKEHHQIAHSHDVKFHEIRLKAMQT